MHVGIADLESRPIVVWFWRRSGPRRLRREELIGPDGTAVNLTGSWRAQGGIYLITQTGSCVAFEYLSELPAEEFGNNYRAVFSGDLRSDFTVVGRRTWTFLRYCPVFSCPPVEELTLGIDFADGGSPILVLRDVALRDVAGGEQTLERFSASTQVPPAP